MNLLVSSIIPLVALLIGYYLGRGRSPKQDLAQMKENAISILEQITNDESDLQPGIIRRPTAQQLNKLHQNEKTKDSKEALKETFDAIPEIREGKKNI